MSATRDLRGSAPGSGPLLATPGCVECLRFMNTHKDCHSPAGQCYHTHRSLAHLTDCPQCKFGTVDRKVWTDYSTKTQTIFYLCADCGKRWTETEWEAAKTSR